MKILLIQYQMLGDVLTSTVIADQLKIIYPSSHIDYLIVSHAHALVQNHPSIDGVIKVSGKKFSGLSSVISLSQNLKKKKYDLLIDPYCKNNSALLSSLSGIERRIGYKKWFSPIAYSDALSGKPDPELFKTGEAVGSRLLLTQPLTDTVQWDLKPKIYLTAEEIIEGQQWLASKGLNTDQPITMVSVLGSSDDKTLPFKTMAEVLDLHVENTNAQLLLNYIPSQLQQAREIYELCNSETREHIFIEAFAPSIRDFLKVLFQCTAIIGNEGGAINMGKALQIPSLSIYSPWIKKRAWNVGEDDFNHISVHLRDVMPELYGKEKPVKFKNRVDDFYSKIDIDLIRPYLTRFETNHYNYNAS